MRSWIGRIRSSLAHFRKPPRVSQCLRVAIGAGSANSGNWSPEIVRIFCVIEGNYAVCEAEVQQCEKTCTVRSSQVVSLRSCLRDLVPIVLDGAVPKPPRQGLVGSCSCTVFNTHRFYFVEGIGVLVAGQLWGRTR